jgi:hydroxymethylpyrimidine/phosphomethylpyrimidine kinase
LLDAAHDLRKAAHAQFCSRAAMCRVRRFRCPAQRFRHALFSHPRIAVEGHGTGCTLAAAIAAGVAKGGSMETAVAAAIDFVNRGLALSYRPGKGSIAVLDHLAAAPASIKP